MRRFGTLLIVAGLAAISFGCRSEQTPEQASPSVSSTAAPSTPPASTDNELEPVADPEKKDLRPIIACFGDSLTAGHGTEGGQSYPDYLQRDLDASGYHYRVVNAGIGGNTTKDGVERVDAVAAMKPFLVVVEFGGNDGLRGFRIEDTRANLDKILSTLKASGTKMVLAGITLPPDYGPDYIRQFNQTYTLLAKKYNVPLLPFLLRNVYGTPGMMQEDGIHATAAGNEIVAKNVLGLIAPLLKR